MSAVLKPQSFFDALANRPIFVLSRLEAVPGNPKLAKIPFDPRIAGNLNAQDRTQWLTAADAQQWLAFYGRADLRLAVNICDGLVCIDIDNCAVRDDAGVFIRWSDTALKICAMFPTAAREVSQSGNGLHLFFHVRATPPHGKKNIGLGVEGYTEKRHIMLSGNPITGDVLAECTDEWAAFVAEYLPPSLSTESDAEWTDAPSPEWSGPDDDDELIRRMRTSQSAASKFGGKASVEELWTRNVDALAKAYPPSSSAQDYDESAADQALANHAAFWAGGNCDRMDRLMRQSSLAREKWDNRPGYLRDTILKACAATKNSYRQRGEGSSLGTLAHVALPPDSAPAELDASMLALHPTVRVEIISASNDTLFLPNDHLPDNVAAERIFRHLGSTHELFRRGDGAAAVVELNDKRRLSVITPTMLQSRLNERGRKVRSFSVNDKKDLYHHAKRCGESAAKVMLSALAVRRLPEIKIVTRMPLLIEREGELIVTEPGYNQDSGVLVTGQSQVPTVNLDDARAALAGLLADFHFAEPGDRARALASLISPALRMARLVRGDALVTAVEADQSQTGKGYLLKLIRALYGEQAPLLTQRSGGVGSLDESLSQAILDGSPFVSLDNLRGALNSPFLEGLLTAGDDPVLTRVPHRAPVPIDVSRTSLQLTSNGVEGTVDLSKRLLLIRLRMQAAGYRFAKKAEGDILAHVEAHCAYYLACIHAVVRYWHRSGKPELETDHRFRHWVGALDWIVQNVWGAAPLLEGHESALGRIADPALSWLRQLALKVMQAGKGGQELPTEAIRELCRDCDVMPPNVKIDAADQTVDMAVGRTLKRCFANGDSLLLDGIHVACIMREERNTFRTLVPVKRYTFVRS